MLRVSRRRTHAAGLPRGQGRERDDAARGEIVLQLRRERSRGARLRGGVDELRAREVLRVRRDGTPEQELPEERARGVRERR